MYKRWEGFRRHRGPRYWLLLLGRAKTWQLVFILIIMGFASATLLRLNNLSMVELRHKVELADKAGDSQAIRQSLAELQHYASSHMNAYPGVVYLKESYNRDYSQALAQGASNRNPNSDIYQQASIACRARFQGGVASFRNDYVSCVAAAVGNLPPEQQQAIDLPNPGTYRYSFSSPLISLDIAGVSVIVILILFCFIIAKVTGAIALKLILKKRQAVF